MKIMSTHSFDSTEQMEDYITSQKLPVVRLGYDQARSRNFRCVQARSGEAQIIVAIKSFGIGIDPKWAVTDHQIIVGYNDRLAFVRIDSGARMRVVDLMTLFVEFLVVRDDGAVVVLCETAVVGLGSDGAELWRYDTDLIKDYYLDGHKLHLKFLDAAATSIDLDRAFVKNAEHDWNR